MAYNTSTGSYQTGDASNHTLKLVKDGTEASPTNSPSEVDSTNAPGAYKVALVAGETQFGTVWLGGKSSTANVIIIPITVTFEILPTALDANGMVKADVADWNGSAVGSLPTNFTSLSIDSNGNVSTTSNIKKNTIQNGFVFVMTDSTTHQPKTGLTVAATRSIDGGAFASTTNSVSEVATGTYSLNLSAADTNGNHIMLRFTSATADDLNISIITQP